MASPEIHLYQITYDEATRAQVAANGFKQLDNLDNPRPDWYEYWPIRNFLLNQPLNDDAWYGFFSPKFCAKTLLSFVQVEAFVAKADAEGASVALFSPQPDMASNFLNVFEQAEVFDPGFNATARQFLSGVGLEIPVESLVMDSRQTVFSNYFAAKPAFWREWFVLTEALFSVAEDSKHPLHAALTYNTTYAANAQRKVFLSERLASLLLYLRPQYKTAVANPFTTGWSMAKFRQHPEDAYINDALKIAFKELGFPQYMDAFRLMREKIRID
jgi:hypothetical protein